MPVVVSGIRSTGNLHLGNYFGAVKNFIEMQNEHKTFFFIADFHSLTTHPTPQDKRSCLGGDRVREFQEHRFECRP